MEEGINQLSCHLHESWQIRLHGSIDIVILVGGDLEVLFKLERQVNIGRTEIVTILANLP